MLQSTIFCPVGRARRMRVTHHLLSPWQAYQAGTIGHRDFDTYNGLHEMHERRRYVPRVTPRYGFEEARALLGHQVRLKEVERSIDQLQKVGLVEFSPERIEFLASPSLPVCPASMPMRQVVDFPRRLLRYLLPCGSPGLFATAMSILLRCRPHPENGTVAGTIPVAWIAAFVSLSERNVRRHLRTFEDLGWLCHIPRPRWYERKYGPWYTINLQWSAPLPSSRATRPTQLSLPITLPASSPDTGSREPFPPPTATAEACENPSATSADECENLSAETPISSCNNVDSSLQNFPLYQEIDQNQMTFPPADPDPPLLAHVTAPDPSPLENPGVLRKETREERKTLPAPTLRHVIPDDLHDMKRLMVLYEQAIWLKIIGRSDPERLAFIALATHALMVKDVHDPCALFFTLLRKRGWDWPTNEQEDAAHARWKDYYYGISPQVRAQPPPVAPSSPTLSKDAWIVRELTRELCREGYGGDVFEILAQDDPLRWTPAHATQVRTELAAWMQGSGSRLPERLLEPHECHLVGLQDRGAACLECGEAGEECLCVSDAGDSNEGL